MIPHFTKHNTIAGAIRLTVVYLNKTQGLLGNYLTIQSKNPDHSKMSLLLSVDQPQEVKSSLVSSDYKLAYCGQCP